MYAKLICWVNSFTSRISTFVISCAHKVFHLRDEWVWRAFWNIILQSIVLESGRAALRVQTYVGAPPSELCRENTNKKRRGVSSAARRISARAAQVACEQLRGAPRAQSAAVLIKIALTRAAKWRASEHMSAIGESEWLSGRGRAAASSYFVL